MTAFGQWLTVVLTVLDHLQVMKNTKTLRRGVLVIWSEYHPPTTCPRAKLDTPTRYTPTSDDEYLVPRGLQLASTASSDHAGVGCGTSGVS